MLRVAVADSRQERGLSRSEKPLCKYLVYSRGREDRGPRHLWGMLTGPGKTGQDATGEMGEIDNKALWSAAY